MWNGWFEAVWGGLLPDEPQDKQTFVILELLLWMLDRYCQNIAYRFTEISFILIIVTVSHSL